MGGLSRHMKHLYENPSLTFTEIKDIFKKINDGKLLVTEKLDGQNLLLSFSVTQGKAKAARKNDDILNGGISTDNVANLTEVKEVQSSFLEALKVFENIVKNFSIEDQINIFGPNANYYYNCEIQDPKNPNVLVYERPIITVHRSGHLKQNKFNKKVFNDTLSKEFLRLEKLLKENVQLNEQAGDGFIIRSNDIRKVGPLKDKRCYENSLKSLQNELKGCGLSDKASLAEYILNRLDKKIDEKVELPKKVKIELLKRLMKEGNTTSKHVYDALIKSGKPELLETIRNIINSEKKLLKEAISPIEEITTQFGAGVLKEFQSSYIKDHLSEVNRLKTELNEIFNIVGSTGNVEAQNFLNNQFKRIKDVNNINSACEGFVFKYNDDVYKITGLFSPLNQILGMKKYSRGTIPPLNKLSENKTAIISFGRFNPPTIGHEIVFKVASDLAKQNKADFFIVPTKTTDKQKNPLTIQEKISYLSKIFPEYNSNILNNTNINTIFDTAKYLSEQGYKNLKVIVGSDRKEQFEVLNKYNKDYNFKSIEIVSAGERLDEGEGVQSVSASKARQAAIDGDVETFMKNFAGRLELEEGIRLMNLIRSRIEILEDNKKKVLEPLSPSLLNEIIRKSGNKWCVFSKKKTKEGKKKKLGCYNSRAGAKNRLRQVEYFKSIKEEQDLEEMAMSGGGVAGHVNQDHLEETEEVDEVNVNYGGDNNARLGISVQKRDDEPSRKERIKVLIMQEEQFMVNRKEFIEEIKLRKVVREALKRKMKEREEKILQEEKQLRLVIRKLLQEKDEEPPHPITGINVLRDLLKKIVPTIENSYKQLTTSKEQRDSFRANLVKATKNLITATETPEEKVSVDVELKEQEDEAELSQARQAAKSDPRFIDPFAKKNEPKVSDKTELKPEPEVDDGLDTTGRDMSQRTFNKIKKQIKDAYDVLSDQRDKDAFSEYLLTNELLHMDIFEDDMAKTPEEPTTPSYEKEKQKLDSNSPEGNTTSQMPSSNLEQPPPASPNPVMERRKRR
jgi:hypothetical protein